ncbi:MAG TPA: S8 family serine peptidase, partial [Verrucomicrobiae bacterium]|nr:S8 family serine peptidase [Verrucomicrobiae bacterium]
MKRFMQCLVASCALACAARAGLAHKVQTSDPAAARAIIAAGGRLIADYGGYQLFASAQTNGLQVRDEYNLILLNAARLDTAHPETQSLRQPPGAFTGKRLRLVQFAGPVQPVWRKALLDAGAQIVNYIPHDTYLIYGDATTLARVRSLCAQPIVQWDGPYQDQYKIHSAARAARTNLFAVQLVADAPVNAATIALLAPVEPPRRVMHFVNVVARLTPADLDRIAARPDVISIQPCHPARKQDERQDQIVAGNISGNVPVGPGYLAWLASKGFTQEQFDASGFVIDVADSGIDDGTTSPSHFGLYSGGNTNSASRVAYARLAGTPNSGSTLKGCDGHGTINAHIAMGYDDGTAFPFADGAGYDYGLGVCPFAQVGSSVIFDAYDWTNPNFTQLESQAYQSGARISNNSWGYEDSGGVYGVVSQEFDSLVRDAQPGDSLYPTPGNQEMVIVFADGDSGPAAKTVLEPGTAKNVLTVGGADNVQAFGGADGCGVGDNEAQSANEIAPFSARGPCADGRRKPDLVAPSTHVSGGVVQAPAPGPVGTADECFLDNTAETISVCGGSDGSFFFPDTGQQFYTASSGTSHSAPCVAGGCALLRQYLVNNSFFPPSPAMTKAYLMNCARYMTGSTADDTLWSDAQGMGELDLGAAFDGTPRILRDQLAGDTFTASGQMRTFTGFVADTNLPFRVTVAWTDAPGNTTGAAYNNNIDLTVNVSGQTYLGNVFSGAWSVTGGSPDGTNNVESVFLPAGVAGAFTVTVSATSINSVGVPNSSNGLAQDFALVMNNAVGAGPAVIVSAGATLAAENCLPTNGVIDPGETVTVNFSLQNIGTADTTNLIATLQPDGGIEFPGGPVVYGALAAGGAPASQPLTFTASGSCGGTITATLQLQDGSNSLASLNFTFSLGQYVPVLELSQNFDGVTSPALPTNWATSVAGGQDPWVTTNGVSDTPPNSAFDPATTNAGIADLISPAIAIATPSAQLVFRNNYDLEVNPYASGEALDGGVLEIQIGTNAYADILAAGGSFVTNGYNMTIAPSSADDNPLPNRSCWSGYSVGFVTTIVNLPAAAAGQTIQLRWRLATDTGNAYGSVGWWIDTVSIVDGGSYVCCGGPWEPLITNSQIQGANFLFSFQSVSNE